MVLSYLPAIDGVKTSGGRPRRAWLLDVAVLAVRGRPLLAPAFFGAALLLFANACRYRDHRAW